MFFSMTVSGSNNQGVYSGESAGSVNSQVDCSSWLRGGLATGSFMCIVYCVVHHVMIV
jgi:hypothetical protein